MRKVVLQYYRFMLNVYTIVYLYIYLSMITRKLNDIMRFQKYVVHACIIPRNIILHGRTEMNGSYFANSSCYLI